MIDVANFVELNFSDILESVEMLWDGCAVPDIFDGLLAIECDVLKAATIVGLAEIVRQKHHDEHLTKDQIIEYLTEDYSH